MEAGAADATAAAANDDGAGATPKPPMVSRSLTDMSRVRGWGSEEAPEEARRQLDREEEDSTHVPSDDDEALPRVGADALGSVYRE